MNEYRRYLNRLNNLVSAEVVPKTAIFDYFTSHIYRRDERPEEVEPLIRYIQSALRSDLTMSIFRLFDENGDRNIGDFLKYTKRHLGAIDWKSPLTLEDLANQEQQLKEVKPLVDKLTSRRNKLFAHYDKEYFYEPNRIDADFPFSNEDAMSLVRVLQSILGEHSDALDSTGTLSVEGFFYLAAERLYEKLRHNSGRK